METETKKCKEPGVEAAWRSPQEFEGADVVPGVQGRGCWKGDGIVHCIDFGSGFMGVEMSEVIK